MKNVILPFLLLCGTLLVGCAPATSKPTGYVAGRISLSGKPLPQGCQLLFIDRATGQIAGAILDATGEYRLHYEGRLGIPAGTYRVQLAPPASATTIPQPKEPPSPTTVIELPPPPFPQRYLSVDTSQLEFTVKTGTNKADFDLAGE